MSNRKKKVVKVGESSKKPNNKQRTEKTANAANRQRKVVPTQDKTVATKKTKKATPTNPKVKKEKEPLLFGKRTYGLMAIGAGLIALGMLLMSGGSMPDPNTWDESLIYGARRTILAPIVILSGLVLNIIAIFKAG